MGADRLSHRPRIPRRGLRRADEYPTGSQINRAVLAAAWQFKVRPPRLGGKLLVGSWVRIRIDYVMRRQ
uniref:Uncharacterized protein n=1 Tax=Solanum lycopersicum TaxID=4081 RepID=A0A494G9U9_SOLLC